MNISILSLENNKYNSLLLEKHLALLSWLLSQPMNWLESSPKM